MSGMSEHYYELKYFCKGKEMVVKFPADISIGTLHENLRDFLVGIGWPKETIDHLFGDEE